MMRSEESGAPGSAGMLSMTVCVSTAMMPTAMPPNLARPVTTLRAQPAWVSIQEPLSKRPLTQGSLLGVRGLTVRPAMAALGSSFSPAWCEVFSQQPQMCCVSCQLDLRLHWAVCSAFAPQHITVRER